MEKTESLIFTLLRENDDITQTADEILKKLYRKEPADENVILNFLYNSGFYSSIVDFLFHQLKNDGRLNWQALAEVVEAGATKLSADEQKALKTGAVEQNHLLEFVCHAPLDGLFPDLSKIFEGLMKERKEEIEQLKNSFSDQCDILHNDELYEEELDILKQWLSHFPSDTRAKERKSNVEGIVARDLISRLSRKTPDTIRVPDDIPPETSEEFIQKMKDIVAKNPELAVDVSIALLQIDAPVAAADVITKAPKSPSRDWAELEIFFQLRRYIDVLELCKKIQDTYPEDPDCLPATILYQAQALWELGNREPALALLEKLNRFRPGFRNSQLLLSKWRQDSR